MSPARRRRAHRMLCDRLSLSERRACQIAGQHRSTQRHEPSRAPDDAALRARLRSLSAERPRWGYRCAHARCSRRDGTSTASGSSVSGARRACAPGAGESASASASRPCRPSASALSDPTRSGRSTSSSIGPPTDGSRSSCTSSTSTPPEALAVRCERRIDADATVMVLDGLVAARGRAPEHVRCATSPRADRQTPCVTGVASHGPALPTSSQARRGRTPTWSPSDRHPRRAALPGTSRRSPRRRYSSSTCAPTITRTVPTRRLA